MHMSNARLIRIMVRRWRPLLTVTTTNSHIAASDPCARLYCVDEMARISNVLDSASEYRKLYCQQRGGILISDELSLQ